MKKNILKFYFYFRKASSMCQRRSREFILEKI